MCHRSETPGCSLKLLSETDILVAFFLLLEMRQIRISISLRGCRFLGSSSSVENLKKKLGLLKTKIKNVIFFNFFEPETLVFGEFDQQL